jgi:hypothetical protein
MRADPFDRQQARSNVPHNFVAFSKGMITIGS